MILKHTIFRYLYNLSFLGLTRIDLTLISSSSDHRITLMTQIYTKTYVILIFVEKRVPI